MPFADVGRLGEEQAAGKEGGGKLGFHACGVDQKGLWFPYIGSSTGWEEGPMTGSRPKPAMTFL